MSTRARLACKGSTCSRWGLDYGRGLLNKSICPSDAMGCIQLRFCKLSSLFLVSPSAGEGKRLSGTGGRVKTFEQMKVHQQHNGGMEHLTDVQQALQLLLLLTCTMLAGLVKSYAHTGCPLLMWHQRVVLAHFKVSRKMSSRFAVFLLYIIIFVNQMHF